MSEAAAAAGPFYTLEELKKPIDGVDFNAREMWLSDKDFLAAMGSPKAEFQGMQKWKRVALKKKVGLF